MPEAVDVGSVLGGRYKVTAYVLASAEEDHVLDGVDQVLNRPVSILVASAGNASQVATSARELAGGERNGNIQVLDLGITDSGTYLVTNRAAAADMLDLIVQQDAPAQDAPYVEPFFTDTLGSEIFGRPRSTEPETYDDDEDEYDEAEHHPKSRLSGLTRRFGRQRSDDEGHDDTSDIPPVAAAPAAEPPTTSHPVPPPPARKPGSAPAGATAGEDERSDHDDSGRPIAAAAGAAAGAAGAGAAGAVSAAASQHPERAASHFPFSGRPDGDDGYDGPDGSHDDGYDDGGNGGEDSDGGGGGRKFTRVLVGVVLTVVLVVAVVLAATQLSSLSGGTDVADDQPEQATTAPVPEEPATATATPSAEPTPEAVPPVITGITRVVPENPSLDAVNDVNLPLIIDGNPATFWGNQVYASDVFGGLATNLALVVQLEEESTVSRVAIQQLNGSGGSFSVLLNDQPTLQGAEQIARGGFTAPTVTLPIPAGGDGPRTGQYVIINFTQLPRLSNIQAQYPFGLRIAEISVS